MIIVTVLATVLVTSAPDASAMITESTKRLPLQPEHRRAIEQIHALGGDVDYEQESPDQLYSIVIRGKRLDDAPATAFCGISDASAQIDRSCRGGGHGGILGQDHQPVS